MYVFLGLLLSGGAILELDHKKIYRRKESKFFLLLLMVILGLRYGQGTDYYNYSLQFLSVDTNASLWVNSLYHGEAGWYILLLLAKKLGMNFDFFIGSLAIVMMCAIGHAIKRYSPYGITSLLLLYPTFYLTYFFSAIRQGLVMSFFLGFGVKFLLEKKYLQYYCLIIILVLFHKSAFILLLLPIALHFKNYKIEKYLFIAVIMGILFGYTGMLNYLATKLKIASYFEVSISIMAILLRCILYYVIYKLHNINIKTRNKLGIEDAEEDTLYYIYMIGFCIYLCLAFAGTLSQRLTMPIKAIEIILLPILIRNYKNLENVKHLGLLIIKIGKTKVIALMMLIILMLNVETIKNIYSYIEQGNYYSWVNPLNYPYSTVFNKDYIKNYISYFNGEIEDP